jgi:hypothetical protein
MQILVLKLCLNISEVKKKLKPHLITLQVTFIFFLAIASAVSQTQVYIQDFESAGGYSTSIPEFTDGSADYFIRTNGGNISGGVNYTNTQGAYYFGAQDIDGEGASSNQTLTITGINITGYTNLELRVFLAEDDDGSSEDWDNSDYVHFNYQVDNTGYNNLLWLENDGSTFNTAPQIDTDFDGIGDGAIITDAFTQFTAPISGTGSSLDIQVEFNLNSGDEDIAIDHIELYATSSCTPPTISSIQPNNGPVGTRVLIQGSGFTVGTGTSAVDFGSVAADSFNVLSNTQIEAYVPSGAGNTIEITTDNCPETYSSFTLTETSSCGAGSGTPTELFISEVTDASSGSLSYIEIFNGTGSAVNLSNYSIAQYNNGNSSPTCNITLSGTLANNDVYVISIGSNGGLADAYFNTCGGVNTNDCIKLLKNSSIIDVWGDCSGSNWVVGANAGYTYRRKGAVSGPNTTFTLSEWQAFSLETYTDIGSHTTSFGPSISITQQPTDEIICEGESATFSVSTATSGNAFQWYVHPNSGTNWSTVSNGVNTSGASTNTLSLTNIPYSQNNYQFYCKITNGSCEVYSVAVQLKVQPGPITTNILHN